MKLLACASKPAKFCPVVAAESFNNDSLVIAHSDGSLTLFDESGALTSAVLNPGKQVTCVKYADEKLIVASSNHELSIISLVTGFRLLTISTPCPIAGISVFEDRVLCWSTEHTKLLLMQRDSFDILQEFDADSNIRDCFDDEHGIIVACSNDVYLLDGEPEEGVKARKDGVEHNSPASTLLKIAHFDSDIVGGCSYNGALYLVFRDMWKVVMLCNNGKTGSREEPTFKLDEELSISAPTGLEIIGLSNTTKGIILRCRGDSCMFIHNNNMQLLEIPENLDCSVVSFTGNASLITPGIQLYENVVQGNEVTWASKSLGIGPAQNRYLIGCSDPTVTALYHTTDAEFIGDELGRVNGRQVFPGPVLKISDGKAFATFGSVALPVTDFNLVNANEKVTSDYRVSVLIEEYSERHAWAGVFDNDYVFLQPAEAGAPLCVIVVQVSTGSLRVEDAVKRLSAFHQSIYTLEELAVVFKERGDQSLLDGVVALLSQMWSPGRIDQLVRSTDGRSLKVLASVYPLYDFGPTSFQDIIAGISSENPTNASEIEAVFWVFIHQPLLVKDIVIPFHALHPLSDGFISRFAQRLALTDNEKLVTDIEIIFLTQAEPGRRLLKAKSKAMHDELLIRSETMALKVLCYALQLNSAVGEEANSVQDMSKNEVFVVSEPQLVHLVSIAVTAARKGIRVGRDVLLKLQDQQKIKFHRDSQILLVPTPKTPGQAGILMEVNRTDVKNMLILKLRPNSVKYPLKSCKFNLDGKTVTAVLNGYVFAWSLYGGPMHMFKRTSGSLEPDT